MTEIDAKETAKWMLGLFPQMTPEQVRFIAEELLRYPVEGAREAIRDHRLTHEFLDFSQLKTAWNAKRTTATMERVEQYKREQAWRAMQDQARKVVEQINDDDLEVLKQAALNSMSEDEKLWYAKRTPRKTLSLAIAIMELGGKEFNRKKMLEEVRK